MKIAKNFAAYILVAVLAALTFTAIIYAATLPVSEQAEAESRDAIGVMPIALPVISGPGGISAIVIATQTDQSWAHMLSVCCAGLTVALVSWICLRVADKLALVLGQTGLNIIGRICGMILSALGIEFIYTSLKAMFPAWIG